MPGQSLERFILDSMLIEAAKKKKKKVLCEECKKVIEEKKVERTNCGCGRLSEEGSVTCHRWPNCSQRKDDNSGFWWK